MKPVSVALFACIVGCAFVHPVSAADAAKYRETVLYTFCSQKNCKDGSNPYAGLLYVNGTLYGTTGSGGTGNSHAAGTVFSLDPSTGTEKVLYSFCSQENCTDGENPYASLLDANGTLYGTTGNGGGTGCNGYGCGTVFSLDLNTGAEKVLHTFENGTDGAGPSGNLIAVRGTLYGTTQTGGTGGCSCGTVFTLNPTTGVETVLHSFGDGMDGAIPYGGLVDVKGTFHGTTNSGGAYGSGTVFALNRNSGAEKVDYSFCGQENCADGAGPSAGLIAIDGTLYGTTTNFGGNGGGGTVFAFDLGTGTQRVLYSFCSQQNCTDGAVPSAKLIAVKGALYGTTLEGGTGNCAEGCGAVFALDLSTGVETVLHSFMGGSDGARPGGGLIAVNDTLYGTTSSGGKRGGGTVFELKKR